ncbi:hypothetical protein [Breoghania sp. JC706]|uniref:hypothetical protein n=1 Tax=Breoghania sp. JC706 TaxID=3117732 RepID=UPI00300BEF49
MATKKTDTPAYVPEKSYEVTFAKVVSWHRTTFRPRGTYPAVKGRVLNELPSEAIANATPVSA